MYPSKMPPLALCNLVHIFNKRLFSPLRPHYLTLAEGNQQTDEELTWLVDFLASTVPEWASQERHLRVLEMRMTMRQVRVISPERVKRLFETIGFRRLRIVGSLKPAVQV